MARNMKASLAIIKDRAAKLQTRSEADRIMFQEQRLQREAIMDADEYHFTTPTKGRWS